MTPLEWFILAVGAAVAIGVVVGLVTWLFRRYGRVTIINFLEVSATHICTVSVCKQFVNYSISNGFDDTEITLRAFKNGVELSAMAPVFERTGPPFEDEEPFDGLDPRLFDGPGNYELKLTISGHIGGPRRYTPTEKTTTYIGLAKGENEIPFKFVLRVIDLSSQADRNSIAGSGHIFAGREDTLKENFAADTIRLNCKYTLLKAFVLRAISDVVSSDPAEIDRINSAGILGPNDDPTFDHPIDVRMKLTLGDGTTIDLGPIAAIGQVFTLPSPVELTQDIRIRIERRSGPVPFHPLRTVITEVGALVECVEP